MCSAVMMMKETATAIACEVATATVTGRALSIGATRWASAGSPIHPRASEEMVMPSWVAARLASRLSTARRSADAFDSPVRDKLGDPAAAHGDQRKFRGDEEAVGGDENKDRRDPDDDPQKYYRHRRQASSPLGWPAREAG